MEQLQQEKKDIMNKMIHGTHLDSISINSLQRALRATEKLIKELEQSIQFSTK